MLKEAMLTRPLRGQAVQCQVCEHYCALKPGDWGKCGVRLNQDGTIALVVYGKAVASHVDPIEKKPLFHFLPGTQALSIGTFGCNMSCQWCQNADISQVRFESAQVGRFGRDLPPETLVEMAKREGIASIAYTYNEPTVYLEYTYDTAVLAHERGIKNVYVSNGFMSSETMEVLTPYLDAINVDLKGFTGELYEEYTGARLAPIKRNITTFAQETDVWIEVTTLIIPELNDSDAELRAAAEWLAGVSPDIPWHLSAFHPQHRMRDRGRTPQQTLQRAHQIGKDAGLHFVYVGNVFDPDRSNTYCYNCGQLLIQRFGFNAKTLWDEAGVCPNCGTVNPGVW